MIWSDGKILPDDGLAISVADRTFEHGLGLFETLRTWDGRPTLLDRHRGRMLASAGALGLPIDPRSFPDAGAVAGLLEAEGAPGDRRLRITATGGTASGRSVVWMRSGELPPSGREGGAVACVNSWAIDLEIMTSGLAPPEDFTARHKTLNYWFKRSAFEAARRQGFDETLILTDRWGYTEAGRSNLFLVADDRLTTCSLDAPIVPGIMRQLVLDVAKDWPLEVREVRAIPPDDLRSAAEIFLTNAVRGIIPVARVDAPGGPIDRPAPGPRTRQLQGLIAGRLWPDRGDAR